MQLPTEPKKQRRTRRANGSVAGRVEVGLSADDLRRLDTVASYIEAENGTRPTQTAVFLIALQLLAARTLDNPELVAFAFLNRSFEALR